MESSPALTKILAVDDEPSITEAIRFIFDGPRYQVTGTQDGEGALARLDANDFYDVVITDNNMPQFTGIDLVRGLKKRGFAGKIVVLSAFLTPALRQAYEQMDVHVLVDKPFDVLQLRHTIDSLAA